MTRGFGSFDYGVVAIYLLATLAVGILLGRNQKSSEDYFVAGRALPTWAILASVVATETSALTFISIPGLAYRTNFTFLQLALGYIAGRTLVAFVLLPKFHQGGWITIYSFLEKRFGSGTRRFASLLFMGTRALGDSVRVFAMALPVLLIMGFTQPGAMEVAIALVVLATFTLPYCFLGGMRADVWTDVVQMLVYLAGAIVALFLIPGKVPGGWSAIATYAGEHDKLRFLDLSLRFDQPHTLLAGIVGGMLLSMGSHGADQLMVQRLLSARNLRSAQIALIGSGLLVLLQFFLFLVIGVALFAFYEGRSFPSSDMIFPSFILSELPSGLPGLVVAAVLAAAMSTISSSLNSLAAVSTHDFYLPMRGSKVRAWEALRVGKLFTLLWGAVLFSGALLYRSGNTSVVTVALSIASVTYGALLGAFLLGVTPWRIRQRDVCLGMTASVAAMAFVTFSPVLKGSIAWTWYGLIGTSITWLTGVTSAFATISRSQSRNSGSLRK